MSARDKITKLLALSKNNPSREESIAALRAAQTLALRHAIDLADCEEEASCVVSEVCLVRFGRASAHVLLLADGIARMNDCGFYYFCGVGAYVYGAPSDIESTQLIFSAAMKSIDTLKSDYTGRGRAYARSWKIGFAAGAIEAMKEGVDEVLCALPSATALVATKQLALSDFRASKPEIFGSLQSKKFTYERSGYARGYSQGLRYDMDYTAGPC